MTSPVLGSTVTVEHRQSNKLRVATTASKIEEQWLTYQVRVTRFYLFWVPVCKWERQVNV